jgi:hypothetical protein
MHRLCFLCLEKCSQKMRKKKPSGMSGCTKFHHPMLHKNNIVMDTVNVIDENKSQ